MNSIINTYCFDVRIQISAYSIINDNLKSIFNLELLQKLKGKCQPFVFVSACRSVKIFVYELSKRTHDLRIPPATRQLSWFKVA